jgi:hypothetical protein
MMRAYTTSVKALAASRSRRAVDRDVGVHVAVASRNAIHTRPAARAGEWCIRSGDGRKGRTGEMPLQRNAAGLFSSWREGCNGLIS